jgi:hypothetical protein
MTRIIVAAMCAVAAVLAPSATAARDAQEPVRSSYIVVFTSTSTP